MDEETLTRRGATVDGAGAAVGGSLRLVSTGAGGDNTFDSTSRLELESYQTGGSNDYGESIRIALRGDHAKGMIAWDDGWSSPARVADPRSLVWIGAHYGAQSGAPGDIHGHWSLEVPDATGAMKTRLEIPFTDPAAAYDLIGVAITNIQTNLADLTVNATDGGLLRIGGGSGFPKDLVWAISKERDATKKRWVIRQDTASESGANAGSDLRILGYSDLGVELRQSLVIQRSTGRIGVGTLLSSGGVAQLPQATLDVRATDGATNIPTLRVDGVTGQTAAAITTNVVATTDRGLAVRLGSETQTRVVILGSGQLEWGDGTAARDTNLYRSAANVLKTDDAFHVAQAFSHLGTTAGFYGTAPIVKPTGMGAAATDPATTMALVNNLRTALINLGLVAA